MLYAASRPSSPAPTTTRAATPAADVLLDLNSVVDRPENEAAVKAEALDRRHDRPRAGGEHEPVVRNTPAVCEVYLSFARSIAVAATPRR